MGDPKVVSKLIPYAEDIGHYWQTGHSSPDIWLARATTQIEAIGGKVLREAFGRDCNGQAAFMLEFRIGQDTFKVVWPVLPTKSPGKDLAARIQAATLLYHDVKARCMTAAVLGTKTAFFSYLLLPDGRSAVEVAAPELIAAMPKLLTTKQG